MIAWRKSSVLRKGAGLISRVPRFCARHLLTRADCPMPVLANSFPKSGTHLLTQILGALPGVRSYGTFLASLPSLTMRPRSADAVFSILHGAPAGELIPAHLFHSEGCVEMIEERGFASFFIYRDPRDVVCSEAHYLAHMNRWHRLHRRFVKAEDEPRRIELAIRGLPDVDGDIEYPDIARRFARYEGWLSHDDTLAIRFEDLVGARAAVTVEAIVRHFLERAPEIEASVAQLAARARAAIAPEASHTFRHGGGAGSWRRKFTERHKAIFKERAGELLIDLGYEEDLAW